MAMHKSIRIHQCLDDWLVRARYHQICLQHTQELVEICQKLGWMVNFEKSEQDPKQIFDFVGYQFKPLPESKLHINYLELKVVLAPKRVPRHLLRHNTSWCHT